MEGWLGQLETVQQFSRYCGWKPLGRSFAAEVSENLPAASGVKGQPESPIEKVHYYLVKNLALQSWMTSWRRLQMTTIQILRWIKKLVGWTDAYSWWPCMRRRNTNYSTTTWRSSRTTMRPECQFFTSSPLWTNMALKVLPSNVFFLIDLQVYNNSKEIKLKMIFCYGTISLEALEISRTCSWDQLLSYLGLIWPFEAK